jgi:hypothetical protein
MVDETSFTKGEWTLLLKSPMIAGMAVTAADPSGLWGLLKESFTGGGGVQVSDAEKATLGEISSALGV